MERDQLRATSSWREPAHFDELEPERLHAAENPVEGRLVDDLAVEDSLHRVDFRLEPFERAQPDPGRHGRHGRERHPDQLSDLRPRHP
jgi:hypothetical protein